MDLVDLDWTTLSPMHNSPREGEIVFTPQTLTCITEVIGLVDGVWWVRTALAPYTALRCVLTDTGWSRVWGGQPYFPG